MSNRGFHNKRILWLKMTGQYTRFFSIKTIIKTVDKSYQQLINNVLRVIYI